MVDTNIMLTWIIISLGILGVILSFMIGEKKKRIIALALSLLIIGFGSTKYIMIKARQIRSQKRISTYRRHISPILDRTDRSLPVIPKPEIPKIPKPAVPQQPN